MAEIYKVAKAEGKRREPFALKLIHADRSHDTEFRRMLVDEAKILLRLVHSNIGRVIELHECDGVLGLVLEYVDGIDLIRVQRALRERDARLPLDAAIFLLQEVLAGLEYAHEARDEDGELLHVVHRDVSPGNVMIDLEGRVRIVDWGIARARNRAAQTGVSSVKGKFRYMAPEQISRSNVSPATDVYAAAATFWELLAGRRIFDDIELPQLMMLVSKGQLPSLDRAREGLPAGIDAVYKRATARDPDRRYATARQFSDALDRLGLVRDRPKCRERLRRLALAARLADGRRAYERAVRDVRVGATAEELEMALLRALAVPDRVGRVDSRAAAPQRADSPSLNDNSFTPAPYAAAYPGRGESRLS